MEEVHQPQSQVSLWEAKAFHYKVLDKLCCNRELNFLVNFNLILLVLKRSYGTSKLTKGCSRPSLFSQNHFNLNIFRIFTHDSVP